MWDLVGNPEYRFSQNEAQIKRTEALINPYMMNGLSSHPYHLDESIFIFRDIRSNFHFPRWDAAFCVITSGAREARWPSGRASDRSKRSGVRSSLRPPCCILEQDTFTSIKSAGNTQEEVAPSRHDWKIVDWNVKPQPKKQTSGAILFAFVP